MSIADKLITIAENEQRVYNSGYEKGKAEGGNTEEAYQQGYEEGQQSVYDEVWDKTQDYGNRRNYRSAFAGPFWSLSGLLPPKYPIILKTGATTSMEAFYCFAIYDDEPYDMTEICKMIDFSEATVVSYFFAHARIKNVTCDLSNCTNMSNFFLGGSMSATYVDNVTLKITENMKTTTSAFSNCATLKTLIFTEDSVINVAFSFATCDKLTTESVDSIINALKDLTGATAKKITFHTDVVANLTEEQANTILAKNWQIG